MCCIISRTASAARSDAQKGQNCVDEQHEPPPAHSSRSSFHDEMSNTCARCSSTVSDALLSDARSDAFNLLQSSASASSPA